MGRRPARRPASKLSPELEGKIDRYIDSRTSTLWSRFFDVKSDHGRREAKAWLKDVALEVLNHE